MKNGISFLYRGYYKPYYTTSKPLTSYNLYLTHAYQEINQKSLHGVQSLKRPTSNLNCHTEWDLGNV